MPAYYNEIDPIAAHVIECLIKDGVIAPGVVDRRSIADVEASDVKEFEQAHFFAGGGIWSVAARLAGWPDDRQLWTGSCPCQPFSVAGKGAGYNDPRHLWPHFFRLIRACRPPVVVGEQVAGKAGYGWFDGVRSDLESENYASRAVDIPACAVNAPHIRQRLYWVAVVNADSSRCGEHSRTVSVSSQYASAQRSGGNTPVADADGGGCSGRQEKQERGQEQGTTAERVGGCDMENSSDNGTGCVSRKIIDGGRGTLDAGTESIRRTNGKSLSGGADARDNSGKSFWNDTEWLLGADGKTRRAKPGLCLLVNGLSGRVGLLRIGGNAIVAPLAAEVLGALLETESDIG